jgi:hypothetical protein
VAVAVVVVVVIAMASGHHGGKSSARSTATTTAPTPTTAAPQVNLSEGVLTQDDLGGAWTAQSPTSPITPDELHAGLCSSTLWERDVAGYTSSFVLNAPLTDAKVVSWVREAPTQAAADAQAAFVTSSSYAPCLHDSLFLQVALLARENGGQVDSFSIDPLPLDADVSNKQAYVASTSFSDKAGDEILLTVDYVELFSGRYEATLEVITPPSAGFDRDTLIQQESERLVQRLNQLPAQGTIAGRSV